MGGGASDIVTAVWILNEIIHLSLLWSTNVKRQDICCSLSDFLCRLTGGTRISQVVSAAHEGGIFSVCVLKDGTMVSGGGKDRKVVLWDHDYRKKAMMEVSEFSSEGKSEVVKLLWNPLKYYFKLFSV